MATAHIPPAAQLSPAAEFRNQMYADKLPRLQHLAWRALNVLNKKNSEVVVTCIQVDSRWKPLVEILMPGHDWDAIRATGAMPVAQGTTMWGICEFVAEEFPDLAAVALEIPPAGKMKAIVLSDEGCTVYELEPKSSGDS